MFPLRRERKSEHRAQLSFMLKGPRGGRPHEFRRPVDYSVR